MAFSGDTGRDGNHVACQDGGMEREIMYPTNDSRQDRNGKYL